MNDDAVRCEIRQGIAILYLNNPPLNVVTLDLTRCLGAALDRLEADDDVRAVVVTGAGERAFCAGSDIDEFDALMHPGCVVPGKLGRQNAIFSRLDQFGKPTIAALNGLAYGGGLEIAVCCDLLVAEEQVRLCLPEIKLGVFPSSGGTVRVTRRIGEGRAKEMMFLGEPITADTALQWGLVNRVVPRGEALDAALALAARLALRPPLALSLCKQVIDRSFDLPLDEVIRHSLVASDIAFSSPECAEGVRAFRAKEEPDFRRHAARPHVSDGASTPIDSGDAA